MLLTLALVAYTLCAYVIATHLEGRWKHGINSPMLVGSSIVIAGLLATHTSTRDYAPARDFIDAGLGPAMLALPIAFYEQRRLMARHLPALLGSIAAGGMATLVIAIWSAQLAGLPPTIAEAIGLKSVTAPVAASIMSSIDGRAAAVASLAVWATARLSELLGPRILTFGRVHHPIARGLAMGAIATTGGVARIAKEHELSGACGGLAVGVCALALAIAGGFVIPAVGAHGPPPLAARSDARR